MVQSAHLMPSTCQEVWDWVGFFTSQPGPEPELKTSLSVPPPSLPARFQLIWGPHEPSSSREISLLYLVFVFLADAQPYTCLMAQLTPPGREVCAPQKEREKLSVKLEIFWREELGCCSQ